MDCTFGAVCKKSSLYQRLSRSSPCYLLGVLQFCVLHLSLWSILIFVKGVSSMSRFFFFCMWRLVVLTPLVKKTISASLYAFAFLSKMIYLSVLLPIPYCLDYCSFIVKSWSQSSNHVLLIHYCVGYSESSASPYKLLLISTKELPEVLFVLC